MSNDGESKERTEIFNKRSRLTRDLAESHKRSIHAFRRNWKLKHEHALLPRAEGIFEDLESFVKETHSMKERYLGSNEWSEVIEDEHTLQEKIQDILAILRWVYWQRLEGYETADVSAIREPSFEDIGGIQQLFAAADALIEDYRSRFAFDLPYDILSVFGLHDAFEVPYPYFISVPRYAKYAFFPSWILFSHEIAHIAMRWVEEQYNKWRDSEEFLDDFIEKWERKITKNQEERRKCLGEIQTTFLQLEIAFEKSKKRLESAELEEIGRFIKEISHLISNELDLIRMESESGKIEHSEDASDIDERGEIILNDIKCLSSRILGEIQTTFLQLEIAFEKSEKRLESAELEEIGRFIKECKTKIGNLADIESKNEKIEHLKNYFVFDVDERGKIILNDIKYLSNRIFSDMGSFLHSCQDQDENAALFKEQIDSILEKVENEGIEVYQTFKSGYNEILIGWDKFVEKKKLMGDLTVEDLNLLIIELGRAFESYERLYKNPESIIKSLEGRIEQLSGNSKWEKLADFFKRWREIRRRAMDIVELMMRLTSGSTGRKILHKPEPQVSLHEEMASEVICDIIATLLSGEYFIYSLCFYYFLPSFKRSRNRKIKIKPSIRDPFILRSFICLEALLYSENDITKIFDLLSNIHLYPSKKYESFGKKIEENVKKIDFSGVRDLEEQKIIELLEFIELLKNFDIKGICEILLKDHEEKVKKEGNFDLYIVQKKMMENLLEGLLGEEESIKKYFIKAKSQFREGNEEEELRSYYNYMGCALQEDLRLLLREGSPNPQKFEESTPEYEKSIPRDNSLRRLVHLVKEFFIREEGSFYDEITDFKGIGEINETAKRLKEGVIIFPSEGRKSEPRNLISAFCYSYFIEKLTEEEHRFEFFKALNSTILSMAWSKEALKRFSSEG